MRMIDADDLLENLEKTEKELLAQENSFDKLLTVSMVQFAKEVIRRWAERSKNHGSDGQTNSPAGD
jgi:hypothetical protein